MPRKKYDRHVKPVRAKGKLYLYFDTGKKDERGRPVRVRLPDLSDKRAYGSTYAALLAGRNRTPEPAASEMVVPEFVRLFQKSPKWREYAIKTQDAYAHYLKRFGELLPTAPASEVSANDVARLMDNMGDTPGAANLFLGSVGALYKWGRGRHVPRECRPTFEVDRFKMGEYDPWPDHVLEAALVSDDDDVRLATHLLYYTAQRLNDVRAMTWGDVRGDHMEIEVEQDKTEKRLVLPFHDKLRAELARTPRRGLAILSNAKGRKQSETYVRGKLQAFAAELGCKVVPHGLRKNAVNALLEIGCTVAETAAISGQTLQLVEHYAKKRDQRKLATAAILKWNKA